MKEHSPEEILSHQEHINFIKSIPQFEQKKKEWLEQRKTRLTSSDAATALGINPYKKPVELLFEKCGAFAEFTENEHTLHGQKYETEAVNKYCYIMGKKNYEFGMISYGDLNPIRKNKLYNNPDYNFLGGSPDGISIDTKNVERPIMIEVKCPKARKIKHGQVPSYYYPQVQLNMFILDLEIADFIEYSPGPNVELNIVRVHRNQEWFDKNIETLKKFWETVLYWRTRDIKEHPEYSKYSKKMKDFVNEKPEPPFLFINDDNNSFRIPDEPMFI